MTDEFGLREVRCLGLRRYSRAAVVQALEADGIAGFDV